MTTTTNTNPSTMTPAEIDTALAPLEAQYNRLSYRIGLMYRELRERPDMAQWLNADIAELRTQQAPIKAEMAPLEAEYAKRGGWARYYHVTNANGHVHNGTDCSTCHYDTTYAWRTDLSGMTADEVVEAAGYTACTVCFPDAPLSPAWQTGEREALEAAKAKAAAKCEGSGKIMSAGVDYDPNRYSPRAKCPCCGGWAAVTATGKLRSHKPKA